MGKFKNCPRCGRYKGGDVCPICRLSRHDKTGTREGRFADRNKEYSNVMERIPKNSRRR